MQKSFLLLGTIAVSLILCLNQPAAALDKQQSATQATTSKISPPAAPKNKKKKAIPKKNTAVSKKKSSTGRCNKPDDLDASGKRCGNRAALVKPGGSK